jgi:dynactin 1
MVCAKLEDADGHIADLKQQLDNALGAEEMLEQLTERTLSMGEVSAWHDGHRGLPR